MSAFSFSSEGSNTLKTDYGGHEFVLMSGATNAEAIVDNASSTECAVICIRARITDNHIGYDISTINLSDFIRKEAWPESGDGRQDQPAGNDKPIESSLYVHTGTPTPANLGSGGLPYMCGFTGYPNYYTGNDRPSPAIVFLC